MSDVKRCADKAREWTAKRNAAIKRAHLVDGLSLRAIAEEARLTHTAIAKILAR